MNLRPVVIEVVGGLASRAESPNIVIGNTAVTMQRVPNDLVVRTGLPKARRRVNR